MKQCNNLNQGQTILETMIAIGILGMTLAGVIILLVNISNYGVSSEARSLAVNYAQEAVDVIKNIRDNEYCSFFSKSGFYNLTKSGNNWQMSSSGEWNDIEGMTDKMKNATGMKGSDNRGRSINVENITGIPASEGKKITVEIRWQVKGSPKQTYITIAEIYKWKY